MRILIVTQTRTVKAILCGHQRIFGDGTMSGPIIRGLALTLALHLALTGLPYTDFDLP